MNAIKKRPALRKTVATGLFVFGVAALALPIIPGWALIGMGLYLLSIDSPSMQGSIARTRAKYRSLDRLLAYSYDKLSAGDTPAVPQAVEKA